MHATLTSNATIDQNIHAMKKNHNNSSDLEISQTKKSTDFHCKPQSGSKKSRPSFMIRKSRTISEQFNELMLNHIKYEKII